MPPKKPPMRSDELFRRQLENIIDMEHPLVKLAGLIDWSRFDEAYGRFYTQKGRPALPTRLMAGLHLLKHMDGLSDEAVCARWVENPYWQYFCGEQFFRLKLPFDRSSMTRWRGRIGPDKLYAFHAPEVECIAKGKARSRCEFGVKTSIAVTNARTAGGQFVVGMQSLPGNPYDGHTLTGQIEQVERLTGIAVERAYVDRGYRGHKHSGKAEVYIAHSRGISSPTIKRELKRRNAVEPIIGHTKSDGMLERNHLAGAAGDAINALLVAAGHNLRLLVAWLATLLRAWITAWLVAVQAQSVTA
jgi:IS5 family transposase